MIKINGNMLSPETLSGILRDNYYKNLIIDKIFSSSTVYEYFSIEQLEFEINLRYHIVNAALSFYKSKIAFEVFSKSRCNPEYWMRTDEGGFQLKKDVRPSTAINDMFINGSKYATECSTAIIIVYYKAILDLFPEKFFDTFFSNIHLMNWHYIDDDLSIINLNKTGDFIPGDCLYFKNPDVDPKTPEWQGENVIIVDKEVYFGHGLGIKTDKQIIKSLNRHRKKDAKESAHLIDFVQYPYFKYLSNMYYGFNHELHIRLFNPHWDY